MIFICVYFALFVLSSGKELFIYAGDTLYYSIRFSLNYDTDVLVAYFPSGC